MALLVEGEEEQVLLTVVAECRAGVSVCLYNEKLGLHVVLSCLKLPQACEGGRAGVVFAVRCGAQGTASCPGSAGPLETLWDSGFPARLLRRTF